MRVRVEVADLPVTGNANSGWTLELPDDPALQNGKVTRESLKDWVWQHGKEQLLSRLQFVLEEDDHEDKDNTETSYESAEEEEKGLGQSEHSLNATQLEEQPQTLPPPAQETQELKQKLTLLDSLHTVKKDFLERLQQFDTTTNNNNNEEEGDVDLVAKESGDEDDKEEEREKARAKKVAFDNNPAHIALREVVDSVLSWSGADYGFLASVQEEKVKIPPPRKSGSMTDVSELDNSDGDNVKMIQVLGDHFAAVNVPIHRGFQEDNDSDNDSAEDDDNSMGSDPEPWRAPQPITTYGPVHYKDIQGSVTLMRDQLRFEPVNPLDFVHEKEDEDEDDEDNDDFNGHASREYNYMEVQWDKVEKYQLTPKTSTRNLFMFKLIFRKNDPDTTGDDKSSQQQPPLSHVILKMKSRAELERIAEDVKSRVKLPSKKKKSGKEKKKKRRTGKQENNDDSSSSKNNNASATTLVSNLTQRERAVMLPPSIPRRMTSSRNLDTGANGRNDNDSFPAIHPAHQSIDAATGLPKTSSHSSDSPAPRRPTRRPTIEHTNINLFNLSFVDGDSDAYDTDPEPDDDDEDDYNGEMNLWGVQELLEKCLQLKRPLCFKARRRDRCPLSMMLNQVDDKDDAEGNPTKKAKPQQSKALLPEKWERLVAVPIFDTAGGYKLRTIFVLARTKEKPINDDDTNNLPNFIDKDCMEWWVPAVTTLIQDIMQQKSHLEQLSTTNKTVAELQGKLRDSLRRHSDMIHGILPPMAISKLKVQPQQWKNPLQQAQQQYYAPKPSVVPVSAGISVDDSSISGSVHSRYGLLVGGLPSMVESNNSSMTYGGTGTVGNNSAVESEYGLYSLAENNSERSYERGTRKRETHDLPERSASAKTAQQPKASSPMPSVPQRTNSAGNAAAIRGLHRQGSVTNRAGATRPIFSRVASKRDMMLMRANSARGGALMRMDSAKRGNLMKMDSGRFSGGRRGIPRLDSLKSLGQQSGHGNASVDTFDQSWRTMYTDMDESIGLEDFSTTGSAKISALSQDMSALTTNVRYINSSAMGGLKDVQALYAGMKAEVSIMVISLVGFRQLISELRVGPIMDMLAKVLFSVDQLCHKYRTIKVETIGNKIVVMSGLFMGDSEEEEGEDRDYHRDRKTAIDALEMAKEMVSVAQTIDIPVDPESESNTTTSGRGKSAATLNVRVGIHLGTVKYGVLGQNVPKLNCFGDDMFVALRMEETAPENCIRVSKSFRDIVGDAETEWDEDAEMIDIFNSPPVGRADATAHTIISSTSPSAEGRAKKAGMARDDAIETYTLEPPPPAISGSFCSSSVASGFPSLAPWTSASNHDEDGLLGARLEESFVSGEFYVD